MTTAQTYYLSKNVPKLVKNLSELKAKWERDVAEILLNKELSDEEKLTKIYVVLPADELGKKADRDAEIEGVINVLPKRIRSRARILARAVLKRATLSDGDLVELPGVGPTAPLIDVLKFFASPRHLNLPLPQQTSLLSYFFLSNKFPVSAFGSGVIDFMQNLINPGTIDLPIEKSTPSAAWITL